MKDAEIHKARLEVFIRYIVDILRIEGIDNKTLSIYGSQLVTDVDVVPLNTLA